MHARFALAILAFAVVAAPAKVAGSTVPGRVAAGVQAIEEKIAAAAAAAAHAAKTTSENLAHTIASSTTPGFNFNCKNSKGEDLKHGDKIRLKPPSEQGYQGYVGWAGTLQKHTHPDPKDPTGGSINNAIVTYLAKDTSKFTEWRVLAADGKDGKDGKVQLLQVVDNPDGQFLSVGHLPKNKLTADPPKGLLLEGAYTELTKNKDRSIWKWVNPTKGPGANTPCRVELVSIAEHPEAHEMKLRVCPTGQCDLSVEPPSGYFMVAGSLDEHGPSTPSPEALSTFFSTVFEVEPVAPHH